MKKFLVIGNPIDHSLSPKLHNYWIKNNNISAVYEKKKINESDIKDLIHEVRKEKIEGINVTVPFKKSVIPFVDKLSPLADKAQSINTIYKEKNQVIGHNTDVGGFELSLKRINYDVKNKKILILGSGGVVTSIIIALKTMEASEIILSNRTREKAEQIKKKNPELKIIDWGKISDFDMIINATSLGLKNDDEIKLDYSKIRSNKLFFDVVYNPNQTKFLLSAKKHGHKTENGKMMFIYQAHQAFAIWNKILPELKDDTIKLLD